MATLTIKNLPDELYAQLKESARLSRRSINSEAIVQLERSLKHVIPDEDNFLTRARLLRERSPIYLSDAELRTARDEGRE
jgi:antitoxin FitA